MGYGLLFDGCCLFAGRLRILVCRCALFVVRCWFLGACSVLVEVWLIVVCSAMVVACCALYLLVGALSVFGLLCWL